MQSRPLQVGPGSASSQEDADARFVVEPGSASSQGRAPEVAPESASAPSDAAECGSSDDEAPGKRRRMESNDDDDQDGSDTSSIWAESMRLDRALGLDQDGSDTSNDLDRVHEAGLIS